MCKSARCLIAFFIVLFAAAHNAAAQGTLSGVVVDGHGPLGGPYTEVSVYRVDFKSPELPVFTTNCVSSVVGCPDANGHFEIPYNSSTSSTDTFLLFVRQYYYLPAWVTIKVNHPVTVVLDTINPVLSVPLDQSVAPRKIEHGVFTATVPVTRKLESLPNPEVIQLKAFAFVSGPGAISHFAIVPVPTQNVPLDRDGVYLEYSIAIPRDVPGGVNLCLYVYVGTDRWHIDRELTPVCAVNPKKNQK